MSLNIGSTVSKGASDVLARPNQMLRARNGSGLHPCMRPASGTVNNTQRCRIGHRLTVLAAATDTTKPNSPSTVITRAQDLPGDLRNVTAVLQTGDTTVYILGMSHVSKKSCKHIQQLIGTVKPDAVLLELCKDRVPLLVDPTAPSPSVWHARSVSTKGIPTDKGWPSATELGSLLKCREATPASASDLEDDAVALLSTGLFRSVKLAAKPPPLTGAPSFTINPSASLTTVAPLGEVEFTVAPRALPPISEFSINIIDGSSIMSNEQIQSIESSVMSQCAAGGATLQVLMAARGAIMAAAAAGATAPVALNFQGFDTGKIVANVAVSAQKIQPSVVTGLESTAVGGKGPGIEPFRRQAPVQDVKAGPGLTVMWEAGKGKTRGGSQPDTKGGAVSSGNSVDIKPWSSQEMAKDAASPPGQGMPGGLQGAFASALTQTYAQLQAAAGQKVGIPPGAAWRTALEAAAANGTSLVFLGDRPANITARRLAQAVWSGAAPFLLGGIAAAGVGVVAATQLSLDGIALLPAALTAVAVSAWPVAGPLVEIWRFSQMSASSIEEVVRLKEPLQTDNPNSPILKFWGEDALLSWPGALDPVINERDEYMDRALMAAATGHVDGLTPVFVRSTTPDGRQVLRYAMPEGSSPAVCPVGRGDGVVKVAGSRTVVAVVGTAHVRGMIRRWSDIKDLKLEQFV